LANQAITLKVRNSVLNGVKFTPNATQTDANGQISYTLSFSENNVLGIEEQDKVYQGFSVAFDMSFEEIWLSYLVGATLWIA
ncbi:hypothetical protein, partial [Acinetobacter nosocomialis]|uniref:hypothetical protein n=1 Tax=Acinetobacter nosocomialis TaxID=106654 RepID=UPI00148F0907